MESIKVGLKNMPKKIGQKCPKGAAWKLRCQTREKWKLTALANSSCISQEENWRSRDLFFSLKAAQGRWVGQTKSRLEFRCFPIESILSPALAPPKTWRVVIFPVAPFVSPESSTSGRIRRSICISLNCQNQNFFVWFLSAWSWQSWRLLLSSYPQLIFAPSSLPSSSFFML